MRSGEENRIYQREWRKQNREKLNRYKAQWAPRMEAKASRHGGR